MTYCMIFYHDGSFENVVVCDIFKGSWSSSQPDKIDSQLSYAASNYYAQIVPQNYSHNWWDVNIDEPYNASYKPKSFQCSV